MTYRAKHVTQWDGSSLAASNCRMAVAATHLDYHTQGKKTSTGAKMRSLQDDQSGGTDSGDAQRAWSRGYQELLVIRDGSTWERLEDDRALGRFIAVDVLYSFITNRCQQASSFGHTMGIAPESRSGQWLVSDPLCTAWKFMDPSDIRRAAEAWGQRVFDLGFSGRTLGCEDPLGSRRAAGKGSPRDDSPKEGLWHSGRTGGSTGLRIRYTTSVTEGEGLGDTVPIVLRPQLADVAEGVDFFEAPGGVRIGDMQKASTVEVIGVPMDKSPDHLNLAWRAVKVATQAIDGIVADKLVYFATTTLTNLRPIPAPPSGGDCTDAVAKRDEQWRTHLTPPPA
jgi:hypothetical protein